MKEEDKGDAEAKKIEEEEQKAEVWRILCLFLWFVVGFAYVFSVPFLLIC